MLQAITLNEMDFRSISEHGIPFLISTTTYTCDILFRDPLQFNRAEVIRSLESHVSIDKAIFTLLTSIYRVKNIYFLHSKTHCKLGRVI